MMPQSVVGVYVIFVEMLVTPLMNARNECLGTFGPELCATQVEDQSFMFIEECIDPRVTKENQVLL